MYISDITLVNNKSDDKHANRYTGGSAQKDHPFIKGYFYVFFGFPSALFETSGSALTGSAAQKYLLTSAESFTPPGDRTLNMQDLQGQGGVDASFITGQTIARDFSIQYKDYWSAPIFRIHKRWANYINPYLGVSTVAKDFTPNEYKGVCMVIQTKPVARKGAGSDTTLASAVEPWQKGDIIKVHLFDGVVSITDFNSIYDANITDNSFVKPVAQYKFDGYPLDETDPDTLTKALAVLNSASLFDKTSAAYKDLATKSTIESGVITH